MTLLLAFAINRNLKKLDSSGNRGDKISDVEGNLFFDMICFMCSNSGTTPQNNNGRFVCRELFGFYFEVFSLCIKLLLSMNSQQPAGPASPPLSQS